MDVPTLSRVETDARRRAQMEKLDVAEPERDVDDKDLQSGQGPPAQEGGDNGVRDICESA